MNYVIKLYTIHVVKNENSIPYPTIDELSLGASPAIEATAAAVIIGAIAASMIDTSAAWFFHEKK